MNLDGGIHEIPLPSVGGRLWLCGKHFIAPRAEETLHALPADQIVCLVQEHELRGHYDDYVEWLMSSDRARWFPIHDLSSPDFDAVIDFYQSVTEDLAAGRRIVAHCAAGRGRAGTLAVAVCQILGMPLDEALAHVRRNRPGAGPEAGAQLDVVRQFERTRQDSTGRAS
ncbi:MAG: protein-tyrosine phosphatase family protein [Ilumatobacteraceae bacterium]